MHTQTAGPVPRNMQVKTPWMGPAWLVGIKTKPHPWFCIALEGLASNPQGGTPHDAIRSELRLHSGVCLQTRKSVGLIQEWDRMKMMGLANAAGLAGSQQVVCLVDWVHAAGADLTLVEALQGSALDPNDSLATALPGIFVFDHSGTAFLSR